MRFRRWLTQTGTIHISAPDAPNPPILYLCGYEHEPGLHKPTSVKLGICGQCKSVVEADKRRPWYKQKWRNM
jgi:hypothetical protein